MPEIKVLPDNLINKIAAGEVIDRPSSVVKELVENSIDAGATSIEIVVKDGGRSLIQIVDDGSGMVEQDAVMALQRHATSKIRTFRDISRIRTLGFRGEALASIASVSQLEMRTVPRGSIEGSLLRVESGTVLKVDRTGGNQGTSVSVRNIFFNTPARRKFLRSGSTEYRHILAVVNRFTLSNPRISFSLQNENGEVFRLKSTSLDERIRDVLGSRIRDSLVPVEEDNALFKIHGYTGNFDILRKSRSDQYLFVNGRYITDRTISAAIIAAYGDSIPRGSYPLYVLFLEIDPERIDVNVHPTKNEIKFADQHIIFNLVRGALKRVLISDDIIPEMKRGHESASGRFQSSLIDDMRQFSAIQTHLDFDAPARMAVSRETAIPSVGSTAAGSTADQTAAGQHEALVWQLHNKYILSQIKSGLVIIDQHAAHERILYEKAKKSFQSRTAASQQLLFPHTVEFSAEDFDNLMEILPYLQKLGFVVKGFGTRTVVVEGVPSGLHIGNEERLLLDILDEYKLNRGSEADIQERLAKSYACRSAIKTGHRLTAEMMNSLIAELFTIENPYFCPHGRPVIITIPIDDLDKRFERK